MTTTTKTTTARSRTKRQRKRRDSRQVRRDWRPERINASAAADAYWERCGYAPSPEQERAHRAAARNKLVAGGERGGKSFWTANEIHGWLFTRIRAAPVWIVGPSYDLARPEFLHLVDLGLRSEVIVPESVSIPREGSCSLFTWAGIQVVTKSSQEPRTLAGIAPLGVAMVEAAQQTHETFLRLRGRVAERRGPLVLSGTFEGSFSWYADLWHAWQADNLDEGRSFSLPTWSNLAVYPGGRDDPEILALEATYPPDTFMERFGAIPCPPATLVLKEFSHIDHVTERAEYNPELPVQLWVDPGYAHAYAVLAMQVGHTGDVYQVDEVYERGLVAATMIERAKERAWWPRVRTVVMDVAGKQHPGTESQTEIWARLTGLPIVAKPVPIVDGILRHRTYLRDPATKLPRLFHHPRCKGTIAEYGLYRYAADSERRAATELPIDRDNDAMKALAYGLMANFGPVARPPRRRNAVTVQFRRS